MWDESGGSENNSTFLRIISNRLAFTWVEWIFFGIVSILQRSPLFYLKPTPTTVQPSIQRFVFTVIKYLENIRFWFNFSPDFSTIRHHILNNKHMHLLILLLLKCSKYQRETSVAISLRVSPKKVPMDLTGISFETCKSNGVPISFWKPLPGEKITGGMNQHCQVTDEAKPPLTFLLPTISYPRVSSHYSVASKFSAGFDAGMIQFHSYFPFLGDFFMGFCWFFF